MRDKTKRLLLVSALLAVMASFIVGCHLARREKRTSALPVEEETNVYKLGSVIVNTDKGEIRFSGRVNRDRGWVQFLLYARGYKWLKEESAIVADADLVDLQNAIALLDWQLWDDLWFRKETERAKQLSLLVQWEEGGRRQALKAQALVTAEGPLEIGDLIFLGSPYFDQIVLKESPAAICARCPLFDMEQEVLRKEFERASGRSGYEIDPALMPSVGTEATMVIRFAAR